MKPFARLGWHPRRFPRWTNVLILYRGEFNVKSREVGHVRSHAGQWHATGPDNVITTHNSESEAMQALLDRCQHLKDNPHDQP